MKPNRLIMTAALCVTLILGGCHKASRHVICYNCATNWGAWGSIFTAFERTSGISIPSDNRNTGQALAAALAERDHPVADVLYLGGQGGIQAKRLGLTEAYRPPGFDRIPKGLKDPSGQWFAVHTGTIGFFVNDAALDGLPVPRSWHDLLDPRYRGMIGYFDPRTAAAGFVTFMAANRAFGGNYDNLQPGLDFFRTLGANHPLVIRQTAYARVLSGEIPIMLDYDFNAYRGRYHDQAPVEFVIPAEGSASFPYVMASVAQAPHEEDAHRFLDFILSERGQKLWAQSYLRPILADAMTADIAARFLPPSDYARAPSLDLAAMASMQARFATLYTQQVIGQ